MSHPRFLPGKTMPSETARTETPTAFPWFGKVTALGASLRDRKYLNKGTPQGGLLKQLTPGTVVTVLGQQGVWLDVWANINGRFWVGYIAKGLVTPFQPEASGRLPHPAALLKDKDLRDIVRIDNLGLARKIPKKLKLKGSSSKKLLTHECLTQRFDGSLNYTKFEIRLTYSEGLTGGIQSNSAIKILADKPLHEYEQELIAEAQREEHIKLSSGRVEESYIIFELILALATVGQSSLIGRSLTAAGIIKSVFFPTAPSTTGYTLTDAAAGEVIKSLWDMLFRNVYPLAGELAVGILSESSAMAIGAFREKNSSSNPGRMTAAEKLARLQSFRLQFGKEQWLRVLDTPIWLKDPNYNRAFGK
ncbi:hypothetical protein [Corallococcus sp. M7]